MNDDTPTSAREEPLNQAIAAILSEPLRYDAEQRVLDYARQLGNTSHRGSPRLRRFPRSWLVKTAVAFMGITILLLIWRPARNDAWAQITNAVAKKPWVLITVDQPRNRCWFSKPLGILAMEFSTERTQAFMFVDLNQSAIDCYSEKEPFLFADRAGVVFRSPIHSGNRSGLERAASNLSAVISNDIPGMLPSRAEVLQHTVSVHRENLNDLVEHQFVLRFPTQDKSIHRVSIVVDEHTHLPVQQTDEREDGSKMVSTFSYPDHGPTDIYAMGVARDTQIVDQRPDARAQQILDQLGQQRIARESYRAFSYMSLEGRETTSFMLPTRLWKDGTRWRIERLQKTRPKLPLPSEVEPTRFWLQFAQHPKALVSAISDGNKECTYHPRRTETPPIEDPDNPGFYLVTEFDETIQAYRDPLDPDTSHSEVLPEWLAYPKVNYDAQISLSLSKDGPEEAICMTAQGRDGHQTRILLHPTRNYAASRIEYAQRRDDDYEVTGTLEIYDYFQTPAGRWLPRKVRSAPSDDRSTPTIISLYYDFDVLPDERRFDVIDR